MTESKTAKRLSTYLTRQSSMVADWEAPWTNVATLAPPWWRQGWKRSDKSDSQYRLLGLTPNTSECAEIMTAEAGLHNDEEVVNFDGPDIDCRLIFCKCLQTLTVSGLLLLTSLLTLRDLLGDALSMLPSMPELHQESVLRNRVGKTYEIVIQKLQMSFFGNFTKCRTNCVSNLRNTLLP